MSWWNAPTATGPKVRRTIRPLRQPTHHSVPRTLELFAGLGGWKQALQAIRPDDSMLSVELDAERARLLAFNYRIPMVEVETFLQAPSFADQVVVADVCDTRWWPTSLVEPFTNIFYSAPCPPWSRGGKMPGFSSDEGLLLAHSFGMISLFGAHTAVGENVDGLPQHPRWSRVMRLLDALPLSTKSIVHDLAQVGFMTRKRCFLLSGTCLSPDPWPSSQVPWDKAGAKFDTVPSIRDVALPEDPASPLFQLRFLPADKKSQASSLALTDGPHVVQ